MSENWLKRQLSTSVGRYRQVISMPWLTPVRITTSFLIAVIIAGVIAGAANSWVRAHQLEIWTTAPDTTFIGDAPTFSTADASYFLRHSMSMHRGETLAEFDAIRSFPNMASPVDNEQPDRSLRSRPLVSVIMASVTESEDRSALLMNGNKLLLFSAVATALMIVICFGAAGYWLEGAVAGIGGGLSSAYLVRSSIGRIDTDQLNLGFLYLIFGLVVLSGRARSRRAALIWALAAGVTSNLFLWWYDKQELALLAGIALLWLLITLQRNLVTVVAGVLIFAMSAGLTFINPFETAYLKDVLVNASFVFPNTLNTITETSRASPAQMLTFTAGSIEMGLVGIFGLGLFFFRHPAIAFAYGPLVAFGLLNFIIGNRAIFFSAPILWFGVAFLITTTGRFIAANLAETKWSAGRDRHAVMAAAALAMLVAWVNSATDHVPRPSFPKPVLEGLASLKQSVDPANSAVATWWDYGYASMFFNDLPTFHDGASQTTPSTHFVARAFLNPDQTSTIGNLKFLSTKGHEGIAAESSLAGLQEKFGEAVSAPSPDLYLVVTSQMAGWMRSISQIGNWDIEKGEPVTLRGNPDGPLVNYERLNCRLGGYPRTLSCADMAFDLERGLVNGAPLLAGWAHSQDGTTIRGKSFDHDGDLAVQIIQTGNRINVFLMHRQLFESSFNELFYLGQIDHPSISLHYDNYPHIRIYKIDGEPAG